MSYFNCHYKQINNNIMKLIFSLLSSSIHKNRNLFLLRFFKGHNRNAYFLACILIPYLRFSVIFPSLLDSFQLCQSSYVFVCLVVFSRWVENGLEYKSYLILSHFDISILHLTNCFRSNFNNKIKINYI